MLLLGSNHFLLIIYLSHYFAVHLIVVVSAKGFYTRQPVIDFVCEPLKMSHRDLEDTRTRIDKEKLRKAISGNVLVFLHDLYNFTWICKWCFLIHSA